MRYFVVNGVPIQQENEPSADFYIVGSWSEITAEQYNELLNPVPIEPSAEQLLEQARATKYAQIQAEEDAIRDAGWEDSQTGLRLFLRDEDTVRYSQFKLLHLNDFADAVVQIGTYQGWQPLSNAEAQALLVRYGLYAEGLYQQYSTRYAMLKYATTIEQIEAI